MNPDTMEYGVIRYGTPLYVFDLDRMEETARRVRENLGNTAGLCYAMKANPFLVKKMEPFVDRIEVCSMGEYRICSELNVSPEKILISGVLKEKQDLMKILDTYRSRCAYTAESSGQFKMLADWGQENHEKIRVYLRVTSGNQFGMDREVVENMFLAQDRFPGLEIAGIHYFSGTQKRTADKISAELSQLDGMLGQIRKKTGYPVRELEYGPGLNVCYFEGQKDTKEEDLKQICRSLDAMQWKGKVTLEFGRALAAECGSYLTSVRDLKYNGKRHYCIVDGGIHQLNYDGQIRGMYRPYVRVIPDNVQGESQEWTVCGSLCTAADILVQSLPACGLRIGSVLAFRNAGAYSMTEGMSLFLSHALPKAAFYSQKEGIKLVRKEHQTYMLNMEKEIRDENTTEYFE